MTRFARRAMLAAVPALAAASVPAIVRAAAPVVLQARCGGGGLPPNHSIAIRTVDALSAIERETDGAVKIQYFPGSELGDPSAQIGQLRLGAMQFGLVSGLGLGAFSPLFNIEGLGFAFRSQVDVLRAYDGALGARLRAEYPKSGIVAVGKYFDGAPQELANYLRPVKTPDDLAGMKVRTAVAPIILDMYTTLGASPVPLTSAVAFSALQTHVADGTATTLEVIHGDHYDEILKYLTMTNHSWSTFVLLVNAEAWRGVPDTLKALIARNIDKAATLQRADAINDQKTLVARIAEKGVAVNTIDSKLFSARLGAYYAKYKQLYGPEVWSLVERAVGKLG